MPGQLPRVYMDHHATTPCDPRVVEAMLPFFTECWGNPSSTVHGHGRFASEAVEQGRRHVADLIGADARDIVFTSGATEADNLALKGTVEGLSGSGDHVITVSTEHKAVLDVCKRLSQRGVRVTVLPVASDGLVSPDAVREAIEPRTVLVSAMMANNETGVLQPIRAIGDVCREAGVLFMTDAVQAVGHVPFDVDELGVDLAALSAHKMYGPKGVGALFVRRSSAGRHLLPLLEGGGQERGLRSGTLNVPGIVGLGKACELASSSGRAEMERLAGLRDTLWSRLEVELEGVHLNGSWAERLPHNLNVSIEGIEGDALLMGLRDIALSSGSACTSSALEPSHVLRAMGVPDDLAWGAVRFGLGRGNTTEEVEYVAGRVVEAVGRLRRLG